ncbi:hypothetical protein KSC_091920 [Ktedonobacter sp. SOSP1-52]|uniref:TetR/AcrR family transcriptional regulator n=1 Tax=Ktedonobacter sp. SOSP1-52 TaxID=2778366 RepID=UPI0019162C22|nr:TetR/AcrR family transcriptional regulator [Ktedonobacter sp. SOSP1-52]GHO70300.1 hypothetical protein KSC_091920 [Ktedonobacter sp. SOSP1-52]
MEASSEMKARIFAAFLRLSAERGIDATTTRALAAEAEVNEVTIFRIFKDKATLIQAVYQHFAPGYRIAAYRLTIDASNPVQAATGLLACLTFLWDCLDEYPQLWLIGIGEYWSYPTLREELAFHHQVARSFIEQALSQAAPMLRPEVDQATTAMSLLGLLLETISWRYYGWLTITEEERQRKLQTAIQPLLQTPSTLSANIGET